MGPFFIFLFFLILLSDDIILFCLKKKKNKERAPYPVDLFKAVEEECLNSSWIVTEGGNRSDLASSSHRASVLSHAEKYLTSQVA